MQCGLGATQCPPIRSEGLSVERATPPIPITPHASRRSPNGPGQQVPGDQVKQDRSILSAEAGSPWPAPQLWLSPTPPVPGEMLPSSCYLGTWSKVSGRGVCGVPAQTHSLHLPVFLRVRTSSHMPSALSTTGTASAKSPSLGHVEISPQAPYYL